MRNERRRSVVIVDDHPVVLQGAARLLSAASDFEVAGTASSGEEAVAIVRNRKPDLIILDLRLPDMLAPELSKRLQAEAPGAKVVIFTAFDDALLLRAALEAGAAALLLKDVHEFDLLRALRRVCAGELIIDERIDVDLQGIARLERRPARGTDGRLTPREQDVLHLLARGMSSKQIALELKLTPNTVRSYSQRLLSKLGAHSRIEAVAKARSLRLV